MFLNGVSVNDIKPNIKKNLELCCWHTPEDLKNTSLPDDFTGYCHNNQVFDNCRTIYLNKLLSWEKNYKYSLNEFTKYKTDLNSAIDKLKTLNNSLKTKETTQFNFNKIKKILDDGYKFVKIHGNKRKKHLDEIEVNKLTEELKNLNNILTTTTTYLKNIETYIYDILKLTHNYELNYVKRLNFKWNNYKDTVSLYNYYHQLYTSTTSKIENYDTILSNVENDLEELEITRVKHKRDVRHKTNFYIDEHGNKQVINKTINQVIIHK